VNAKDLFDKLWSGDRFALSKAITLIESQLNQDLDTAYELLQLCEQEKDSGFRIAITGPPGVGKSTLIEQVGLELIARDEKVAVLAIDPSSIISRGSILGDKSRMLHLGRSDQAFIRPSPDHALGGGIAAKTYEVSLLCATAGFKTILLETVGVGQSETAVAHLADMTILLVQPGAGDELQSIKRGIIEMADLLLVSKADGVHEQHASEAVSYFSGMLGVRQNGWQQVIQPISAVTLTGMPALLSNIESFKTSVDLQSMQQERAAQWLKWRFDQEIAQLVRGPLAESLARESALLRVGKTNPSRALETCRKEIKALLGL